MITISRITNHLRKNSDKPETKQLVNLIKIFCISDSDKAILELLQPLFPYPDEINKTTVKMIAEDLTKRYPDYPSNMKQIVDNCVQICYDAIIQYEVKLKKWGKNAPGIETKLHTFVSTLIEKSSQDKEASLNLATCIVQLCRSDVWGLSTVETEFKDLLTKSSHKNSIKKCSWSKTYPCETDDEIVASMVTILTLISVCRYLLAQSINSLKDVPNQHQFESTTKIGKLNYSNFGNSSVRIHTGWVTSIPISTTVTETGLITVTTNAQTIIHASSSYTNQSIQKKLKSLLATVEQSRNYEPKYSETKEAGYNLACMFHPAYEDMGEGANNVIYMILENLLTRDEIIGLANKTTIPKSMKELIVIVEYALIYNYNMNHDSNIPSFVDICIEDLTNGKTISDDDYKEAQEHFDRIIEHMPKKVRSPIEQTRRAIIYGILSTAMIGMEL